MIVKKVQKIPDARTSAAAYFHDRFIYIIGGNLKKSRSTDMCCKLDIYKRKWYNMPNMNEHRANSGSMVINNYLYAFGGFQTQSYGQIGVDTIERLDLRNPKATWKM